MSIDKLNNIGGIAGAITYNTGTVVTPNVITSPSITPAKSYYNTFDAEWVKLDRILEQQTEMMEALTIIMNRQNELEQLLLGELSAQAQAQFTLKI